MARNCWPDPKAGTLHGTGPGVAAAGSGSGSAVRYEATNGTQDFNGNFKNERKENAKQPEARKQRRRHRK